MKSLSPNAQEFVPFKTNNTALTTSFTNNNFPLIIINSDSKPTMPPIAANPIMRGYISQPPYVSYQSTGFDQHQPVPIQPPSQTVLTFNNMAELNNYMYHQNQQKQNTPYHPASPIHYVQPLPLTISNKKMASNNISPTHAVGNDSIEIPHHPHSTSIIPIPAVSGANISSPAFFTFTAAPPPPPPHPHPSLQTVPVINTANYSIDPNSVLVAHHQQQPHQHHFSSSSKPDANYNPIMPSNKMNQQMPKRTYISNNNKSLLGKKQIINKSKPKNFQICGEQDWPILTASLATQSNFSAFKNNALVKTEKKEDDDGDETVDEQIDELVTVNQEPKKPYIEDESKLKKVIKNVDFIKKTVEQHYNYTEGKLSFKDVVLTVPKLLPLVNETNSANLVNVSNKNELVETAEVVQGTTASLNQTEKCSEKKRRKRSRSKKKTIHKQDSVTDDEVKQEINKTFNFEKEDFPDLMVMSNFKGEKSPSASSDNPQNATLDENSIKASTQTDSSKKANKEIPAISVVPSGGKKLHKPIIVEFANMITALEKGSQNDTKKSLKMTRLRSKSQLNASQQTAISKSISKDSSKSLINPLDSCPVNLKRGKEREKPKQKKPSTLKKIILKEREEKRIFRELQQFNYANSNSNSNIQTQDTSMSDLVKINKQENLDNKIKKEKESIQESENTSDEDDEDKIDDEEERDEEEDEDQEIDENSLETDSPESNKQENIEDTGDDTLNNNNLAISASNPMSPISQGSPISIGGYTPTTYSTLSMLANDHTLLSLEKLEEQVKQKIHNKKFREYCNQIINKEIDEVCSHLLHEIVRFQDRLYHKNPAKAKTKRRYVMGIREVNKHLKLQKLKCVILAPNCEKIQSKGGLDDAINLIIQTSMEQNVPFVFALGRKGLGKAVNKLVPISVVGIFDYSGAEEYFRRLVELANNAKLVYQEMVEDFEKDECENLIIMQSNAIKNLTTEHSAPLIANNITPNPILTVPQTANTLQYHHHHLTNQQIIQLSQNPKIPSHMGHSRNSSTGSNISIEPFAYHINYHTHSRSASGNFNFGQTTSVPGHSRSASGGNSSIMNIDFSAVNKHWTHSRTPSNCSNISFISRLSEPISEVGSVSTLLINNSFTNLNSFNSASNSNLTPFFLSSSNNNLNQVNNNSALAASLAAVQYYTEQVRQEMREQQSESLASTVMVHNSGVVSNDTKEEINKLLVQDEIVTVNSTNINSVSTSLVNLHLGCINEDIDAGNEADTEADQTEIEKISNKQTTDNINNRNQRQQTKPVNE